MPKLPERDRKNYPGGGAPKARKFAIFDHSFQTAMFTQCLDLILRRGPELVEIYKELKILSERMRTKMAENPTKIGGIVKLAGQSSTNTEDNAKHFGKVTRNTAGRHFGNQIRRAVERTSEVDINKSVKSVEKKQEASVQECFLR